MEILFWLVPPVVVTAVAAIGVGLLGRERREPDRDEAADRLARALSRETPRRYAAPPAEPDRSNGIAVRPSRRAS